MDPAINLEWIFILSKTSLVNELNHYRMETGGSKRELRARLEGFLRSCEPSIVEEVRERNREELLEMAQRTQVYVPLFAGFPAEMEPCRYEATASSYNRSQIRDSTHKSSSENDTSLQPSANRDWKMMIELLKSVPILREESGQNVFRFLKSVYPIHKLKIVNDSEFIKCLLTKVTGRALQIFGDANQSGLDWETLQDRLVGTFIPTRMREEFIRDYITRYFQSPNQDFSEYIRDIQGSNSILRHVRNDNRLIDIILQNMWGPLKSHFIFNNKPDSFIELLTLADSVKDNIIADQQRVEKRDNTISRREIHGKYPTNDNKKRYQGKCWRCGRTGHIQANCKVNLGHSRQAQENS